MFYPIKIEYVLSRPIQYTNMSSADDQDTGKFRKNTKDQYYTKSSVAQNCIHKIYECVDQPETYQWIEPSAGNGAFLHALPAAIDKIGIDIEPKSPDIIQADFLIWIPERNPDNHISKRRIFFGNPPFGRQSSLAKSFIKHACKYADVIGFILPRSFVKPSMSRVFPLQFHCLYSEELEKKAFEVNGVEYDVPCIFQIWQKKDTDRVIMDPVKEEGFRYVKNDQPFDVAFKRVGGLAGKCYPNSPNYNPNYHYFLKLDAQYVPYIKNIIDAVNLHVFPSNTVGPRSLSKSEANEVLNVVLVTVITSLHSSS